MASRHPCRPTDVGSPPTIIDCLDNPKVFGPFFRGPSWQPWRAFLTALFALPMSDSELALYRHHTERATAPTVPFREAALVVGRRGGKSQALALVAAYLSCFRDYEPHLSPGERATVAVIASDRKQARSIFRYTLGLLEAVPPLAALIQDATADTIILRNRVTIEIATASFRVTRGYSFAAVLADETAFWRDENSANPDLEIFKALRPGLASIPGAILLNASSPYRKTGVLYNSFRRNYGRDDARVLVWRGTSLEMNASLDPAIVAEAFEDDPISAAAEYGAEFRSDIGEYVSRDIVESCIIPGRTEMMPVSTVRNYVAFCDPSGGSADSMTLAIAHLDGAHAVLDCVREVKPPFSPESVVMDFCELLKSYRLSRVTGDYYAGEWPTERFNTHGITYVRSEKSKGDIYRDSLPRLNSGTLELLDIPRLTGQLCSLERRTARGGRDSIDHPPGLHDDLANAAMGALLLAGSARQPIRINPDAIAIWSRQPVRAFW